MLSNVLNSLYTKAEYYKKVAIGLKEQKLDNTNSWKLYYEYLKAYNILNKYNKNNQLNLFKDENNLHIN